MADITVELEAPEAYDLRRTMAASRMGKYDPTLRLEHGAMALALRTPEGPASLAVEQRGRRLVVHGFGDGAPWLMPLAAKLLGLEDDPGAFEPEGVWSESYGGNIRGSTCPRSRASSTASFK